MRIYRIVIQAELCKWAAKLVPPTHDGQSYTGLGFADC